MPRKKPYLNNRDLLKEIHKSKTTFCSYIEPEYNDYDIILPNLDRINIRTTAQAKRNRVARIAKLMLQEHEILYPTQKFKQSEFLINWKTIPKTDIIYRIMTFDHIPLEPGRKKNPKTVADHHVKLNFGPYQHWKFDENDNLICVGKSHWEGGLKNGWYSKDHGNVTNELAKMYMKLNTRYASRGNWRGYCVTNDVEALTHRGWLNSNEITENDQILSYNQGILTWSKIKSIYRGDYDGLMHKLTTMNMDSLVTPNHKLLTKRGLVPVEYILGSDEIILIGQAEQNNTEIYSDSFVELIGWILTEGHYEFHDKKLSCICIWQNKGINADRIRKCLNILEYEFSETKHKNIRFRIFKKYSQKIINVLKEKNLSMEFILNLSTKQRELLLETMILGDGHQIKNHKSKGRRYDQKCTKHMNMFQLLCTLSGYRTHNHQRKMKSFNKKSTIIMNRLSILSKIKNITKARNINFHGGLVKSQGIRQENKLHHPNVPTEYYKGRVWCPETEYGCFVARRNGTVYLTGNSYNDEMQAQGIAQLTQTCLQFDESKSQNPFAYYTAIINAAFTRVLNLEKRGQNIRDDILEINNFNPSFSRQNIDKNKKYNDPARSGPVKHIDPEEYLKMKAEEEKSDK